jgi:hypothetical protein
MSAISDNAFVTKTGIFIRPRLMKFILWGCPSAKKPMLHLWKSLTSYTGSSKACGSCSKPREPHIAVIRI